MPKAPYRIGLIADTHGLLRPQTLEALRGSDHILHAGDVGDLAILQRLAELAPVTAVRGNNDTAAGLASLPELATVERNGLRILLLHDIAALPADAAVAAVVSGHSHQPRIERRGGVLYVNPGSAGPRRFKLPVSLGLLYLRGQQLEAELLPLTV